MTEDSHSDAGLVFILSGSLVMSQKNNDLEAADRARADSVLYTAFPVSGLVVIVNTLPSLLDILSLIVPVQWRSLLQKKAAYIQPNVPACTKCPLNI